jgi:hypothetical protein
VDRRPDRGGREGDGNGDGAALLRRLPPVPSPSSSDCDAIMSRATSRARRSWFSFNTCSDCSVAVAFSNATVTHPQIVKSLSKFVQRVGQLCTHTSASSRACAVQPQPRVAANPAYLQQTAGTRSRRHRAWSHTRAAARAHPRTRAGRPRSTRCLRKSATFPALTWQRRRRRDDARTWNLKHGVVKLLFVQALCAARVARPVVLRHTVSKRPPQTA